MASGIDTRLVVFDTSVVDLTDELQDPVDLPHSPAPRISPTLMAATIERRHLGVWAGEHDVVAARGGAR